MLSPMRAPFELTLTALDQLDRFATVELDVNGRVIASTVLDTAEPDHWEMAQEYLLSEAWRQC